MQGPTGESTQAYDVQGLVKVVNRIVPIFLSTPDDEMYNEVLKILLETTGSRHGFFGYIDENGALVAPSMTKDIWEQCQIPGKTYVFPRESWGGTWGRALLERRSVLFNGRHRPPEGHIPIMRSICVPLVHAGEMVGLLAVANRESDYVQEDVDQMEAIADIVAPVLHARLERDRSERERMRAEEALMLANKKLELMGTITRHDALNQLGAILGYAEIMRDLSDDPKATEYIDRIEKAGRTIRAQLEFQKTYQALGTTHTEWQRPGEVFDRALSALSLGTIEVRNRLPEVEVYCDMMLERIFYNLAENSLRHGERIRTITVWAEEAANGLTIVYEDDGVGVPDREKEVIFHRGYGKHTGYGLYVTREILDLTGIAIKERGIPGKGVRFEIMVPAGGWRKPKAAAEG